MMDFTAGVAMFSAEIGSAEYPGYYLNFGPGEYTNGDGIFTDAYNDYFASYKVTKGCCVTFYEDDYWNESTMDSAEPARVSEQICGEKEENLSAVQ